MVLVLSVLLVLLVAELTEVAGLHLGQGVVLGLLLLRILLREKKGGERKGLRSGGLHGGSNTMHSPW